MLQAKLSMQNDTYAAPSSLSPGWESWDKGPVASQLCSGLCGCSSPGERRDKNHVTSLLKIRGFCTVPEHSNSSVLIPGWASTAACNAVNHRASRTQWHGSLVRRLLWRNFSAGLLSIIFIQLCGILEMILKALQGPSSAGSGSSLLTVLHEQSWGFGIWVETYEMWREIFFSMNQRERSGRDEWLTQYLNSLCGHLTWWIGAFNFNNRQLL